jgi:hypothetical protein
MAISGGKPQTTAVDVVADAPPITRPRADRSPIQQAAAREKAGSGLIIKLLAVGFWATLAALIVSAAVAPGFAVLALLPLAGMPYLVFCWIAWAGDRTVE